MRNFILLFNTIALLAVLVMASEDTNETNGSSLYGTDTNITEFIINDGSGVINNQNTEKPSQYQP